MFFPKDKKAHQKCQKTALNQFNYSVIFNEMAGAMCMKLILHLTTIKNNVNNKLQHGPKTNQQIAKQKS